ncbi:MAG: L-rhamnose/proton symporter RhaT [Planctomycetaceae bacterium]|jgi:L-rhamnose-H+ transport protein|nr:L-rhamnose/proton symporter RhaT [Planctomycetaceae bacterium]
MGGNPFLGVFFHWLGGLASGSFYVPYRAVRKWSWEVFWLTGGFFSWIIAPWVAAFLLSNDLCAVLRIAFQEHFNSVGLAFLFGMMWGMGGLTFGLTMRYLGMSLGMAVALSYCTVFGTLMPPIFRREFVSKVCGEPSGILILFGLGICILGIVIAALAGMSKEREMSEEAKRAAIKEFSFTKGLLVATFSGIMSAGMSFGMAAATPIADISLNHGTPKMWSELPRLCVILAGGFTANFVWCLLLFLKNKTGGQFFAKYIDNSGNIPQTPEDRFRVPMLANYIFCAVAGTTWYLQFFFYSMGETQMGAYQFSSWPLHMASIMIFSSLWGIALKEWKGSSGYTKTVLFVTLVTLIFSTIVMGYGTHLGKITNEARFYSIAEQILLERDAMDNAKADQARKADRVKTIFALTGKIAKFDKPAEKTEAGKDTALPPIIGLAKDIELFDSFYLSPLSEEGKTKRKINERDKKIAHLVRDIAASRQLFVDTEGKTESPEEAVLTANKERAIQTANTVEELLAALKRRETSSSDKKAKE